MTSYRTISFTILVLFCTVSAEDATAQSDELTLYSLFGSEELAQNINTVRRVAASLPLEDRYEYLHNWVLPSDSHPDFRVVGELVPTDPSPLAIKLEPYRYPSENGGEHVSPVFDLLVAAKESGRLEELYSAVESVPESSDSAQLRARLSLQIMIRLDQGKSDSLETLLAQLHQAVDDAFRVPDSRYEAELCLLSYAIVHLGKFNAVGDLLGAFFENRFSMAIEDVWESQICTLMERYSESLGDEVDNHSGDLDVSKFWLPVARSIAMTRGNGYPATEWRRTQNHELHLRSGHHRDYLFFAAPLTGEYEVVGELDTAGRTQIMTGGLFVGPRSDHKSINVGKFRTDLLIETVDPPFQPHGSWTPFRAVVSDHRLRVYLYDRLLVDRNLGTEHDPWIAARGVSHSTGALRHLSIAGKPQIPHEILISTEAMFTSWYTYYFFAEDAGNPQSLWKWRLGEDGQGEFIARRYPVDRGSSMESVLRYHRPLVEDGAIEYDFVYVPGQFSAHPVLDRLVFLLDPDGVKLHWLTDGRYDRTPVTPDHTILEPDSHRGPAKLPLKEDTWNHLKLSIAGQVVSLELNGELIYERELEPTNLRTFGLFRYADRSELRVRDVVMRGDWPKTIPPLHEQQFADPRLVELQAGLGELPVEFRHDFVRDGLPEKYFKLTGKYSETGVIVREDGVHIDIDGVSGWSVAAIMPQFSVSGDFDIRARFELRALEAEWQDGLAFLEVRLADEQNHYFRSMRGRQPNAGQTVRSQLMWGPHDERRRITDKQESSEAQSGCFRIARIGDRLYSLFAPEESTAFRVLRAETITDADVEMSGILLELALRDVSQGHVVWKDLSIKAEQLKYLAPDQKPTRTLFAMSPDGTNLRELAKPRFGLDHLGSPEFSADGSRIVMDMSRGPTTTSHVVIMNRDGSDMKDLGMGCMPSISKDGKQIVFTDPRVGIVRMDADGEHRKTIDRSGWGVQYSPDGKYIAYASRGNISLMDSKTEVKIPLFEGELAKRYSRIFWNFGWSHNSQAIAFKGHVAATGQQELAVVDINKPDKVELLYSGNGIYEDFTFSPDNQSVLFALRKEGPSQPDLYLAHRKTPGQIARLEGQPNDYQILDCDWSPDGKDIVFAALVDPVPVDWPLDDVSESKNPE